jgi:hypothetical protein
MPDPEKWTKIAGRKEFIISIPGELHDRRIRVRYVTQPVGVKKKKREISIFSVGLEIEYDNKWIVILRHCNYHDKKILQFHTHNPYGLITFWGDVTRIIQIKHKKKTPASQFRWAVKNIRNNIEIYTQKFYQVKKANI